MRQPLKYTRWITPRHGGFTLLEVMIALLVLSIGLLGLAALQTTGLRTSQMADLQTRAVQATADMVERMRANAAGTTAGQYDITRSRSPRHTTTNGRALIDLTDWRASLARLPDGQGEITSCWSCTGSAAGMTRVVTVWWNAARDPAIHGFNCPPLSAVDLRCFRLVMR
jgi:type IV pilus assembly protein PilV